MSIAHWNEIFYLLENRSDRSRQGHSNAKSIRDFHHKSIEDHLRWSLMRTDLQLTDDWPFWRINSRDVLEMKANERTLFPWPIRQPSTTLPWDNWGLDASKYPFFGTSMYHWLLAALDFRLALWYNWFSLVDARRGIVGVIASRCCSSRSCCSFRSNFRCSSSSSVKSSLSSSTETMSVLMLQGEEIIESSNDENSTLTAIDRRWSALSDNLVENSVNLDRRISRVDRFCQCTSWRFVGDRCSNGSY